MKKEIKLRGKEVVGWLGDTYKETYVNIIDIFQQCYTNMDEEQQLLLLQELALEDAVSRKVVDRIIGNDIGWSLGDQDDNYRLEILKSVEQYTLKTLDWKLLGKIISRLQSHLDRIKANKSIYYLMYHDPIHSDFFKKWLKENNVKSEYEQEEKDFKEFVEKEILKFIQSNQ